MIRICFGKVLPVGKLKIRKLETRGNGAAYKRKRIGILISGSKPAIAGNGKLQ
jgi:hypothetical protein